MSYEHELLSSSELLDAISRACRSVRELSHSAAQAKGLNASDRPAPEAAKERIGGGTAPVKLLTYSIWHPV